MRLIDRDEMLSPKIWDMNIPNDVPKVVHDSLFELYNRLIHIPTVDAEPVVRCKDCKYMSIEGKTTRFYFCNEFKIAVDDCDFCSRGERR